MKDGTGTQLQSFSLGHWCHNIITVLLNTTTSSQTHGVWLLYMCYSSPSYCGQNVFSAAGERGNKIRDVSSVTRFVTKRRRNIPEASEKWRSDERSALCPWLLTCLWKQRGCAAVEWASLSSKWQPGEYFTSQSPHNHTVNPCWRITHEWRTCGSAAGTTTQRAAEETSDNSEQEYERKAGWFGKTSNCDYFHSYCNWYINHDKRECYF